MGLLKSKINIWFALLQHTDFNIQPVGQFLNNREATCQQKQQSITPKQPSTTSTQQRIIARPQSTMKVATTKRPLTMHTWHTDIHIMPPFTQRRQPRCTSRITATNKRRGTAEPEFSQKIKFAVGRNPSRVLRRPETAPSRDIPPYGGLVQREVGVLLQA